VTIVPSVHDTGPSGRCQPRFNARVMATYPDRHRLVVLPLGSMRREDSSLNASSVGLSVNTPLVLRKSLSKCGVAEWIPCPRLLGGKRGAAFTQEVYAVMQRRGVDALKPHGDAAFFIDRRPRSPCAANHGLSEYGRYELPFPDEAGWHRTMRRAGQWTRRYTLPVSSRDSSAATLTMTE